MGTGGSLFELGGSIFALSGTNVQAAVGSQMFVGEWDGKGRVHSV